MLHGEIIWTGPNAVHPNRWARVLCTSKDGKRVHLAVFPQGHRRPPKVPVTQTVNRFKTIFKQPVAICSSSGYIYPVSKRKTSATSRPARSNKATSNNKKQYTMATKTTKNNRALTYPCIVEIKMAMGLKRKDEVIRAIDRVTGEDLSKTIVYPTLRNAFYAGVDLVKESIDSKWVRIEKKDAEARQVITNEGLCDHIAPAAPVTKPAKAAKPAKVHKPAKAATPVLGAPAKSKKATKPAKAIAATPAAVAKASKATKASSEDFEPTEADIQEIQHMLAMGLEDSDSLIDGFDSI